MVILVDKTGVGSGKLQSEVRCGLNKYQLYAQKHFSIQTLLNEIEELEFSIMNRFFLNSLELLDKAIGTKNGTQRELVDTFKATRKNRKQKSQFLDNTIQEKLLIPSLGVLGNALKKDPLASEIDIKMDAIISTTDLYIKTLEGYRDNLKKTLKDLLSKDSLN